ncbi:MAG TPA: PEP-CTERM sorting domain-containing protein [Verrucomicrobiae bacterium]
MKKLAFPLACALLAAASANAANIIWISFHPADNQPSANAAAAGFTSAPDVGYTQALTAAGHNVTRVVSSPTPNLAQLNAADLVIISRSVASGDYDAQTETAAWNSITAPTMILGGYVLRNSRLGYVTGATIPDTVNPVTLQAVVPNHPIFNGITLGTGNTLSYAVPVSYTNNLQRGISVNTDPLAGGGTLIAKVDPAATSGANGLLIGEWQAGATMADTAPSDTLGGHRLVFLTGSRENVITAEGAGMYDLTPEGKQLFLNAVSYMAVPEPSTYALVGLGGMALFFRRRKA